VANNLKARVTPNTFQKSDLHSSELRHFLAEQLGMRVSSIYAWASVTRDIPTHLEQTVCDLINEFREKHQTDPHQKHNTGR
jgi:hypothetical protein